MRSRETCTHHVISVLNQPVRKPMLPPIKRQAGQSCTSSKPAASQLHAQVATGRFDAASSQGEDLL